MHSRGGATSSSSGTSPDTVAGGNELIFPPCEPWPEEVDGAELLDDLSDTIRNFVVIPRVGRDAVALWILQAHVHDAAQVSPLLMVTSPEKRCGKTTLGTIIGSLVPRPLYSSSLTPPVLFRSIESFSPTLIIDEVDTFLGDRAELRGILNTGHNRTMASALRSSGNGHRLHRFSTWAPKVIIGIEANQLNSMLIDRSIVVELRRRISAEPVEPLRLDKLELIATPLRQRATRWAADHIEALRTADPEVPPELNDRARDHWRMMFAVAAAAGPKWQKRAHDSAMKLSGGEEEERGDDSPGVRLLTDVRELFASRGVERIGTAELLVWLRKREDRSWGRWMGGKPLSANGLSKLLRVYDIGPKCFRSGAATARGYELAQFADAFARYLPQTPQQLQQPQQSSDTTTYDGSVGATGDGDVAGGSAA